MSGYEDGRIKKFTFPHSRRSSCISTLPLTFSVLVRVFRCVLFTHTLKWDRRRSFSWIFKLIKGALYQFYRCTACENSCIIQCKFLEELCEVSENDLIMSSGLSLLGLRDLYFKQTACVKNCGCGVRMTRVYRKMLLKLHYGKCRIWCLWGLKVHMGAKN